MKYLVKKSEVFSEALKNFETEELKLFCKDLLDAQFDKNMTMPSSTSYKYHNKTQCQPGGQVFHVLMVAEILEYILGLEYIQSKISHPKKRDCMRVAALCHDIMKTNGGNNTVHEHPILGGEYVKNTPVEHDVKPEIKQYIARLIESHSGEWTTSNRSTVVLPKPENDEQFYIHLADYLASRSNIDMVYTDEQIERIHRFQDLPNINEYKLLFGKYKGRTLTDVNKCDHGYIEWLKEQDMRFPVNELVKLL